LQSTLVDCHKSAPPPILIFLNRGPTSLCLQLFHICSNLSLCFLSLPPYSLFPCSNLIKHFVSDHPWLKLICCMTLKWNICVFLFFLSWGRRNCVSEGQSNGRSAQSWKADTIQMFPGRCAERKKKYRTLFYLSQEMLNTVCMTTPPVWSCFHL